MSEPKLPTVDLVAGARPNFMKLAPVWRALEATGRVALRVVHTGQHYDSQMNDVFFAELGIPAPEVHLSVGSGHHGAQTARILERYEAHLLERGADATVVFGDVNSTVACALAAVKLGVRVVHVEAGLRSFDRTMPEEVNRLLTDAIADLLLVSEPSGVANLRAEGVAEDRIRLVGNVMIDTLTSEVERARELAPWAELGLAERGYGLVTLHRPSNVDAAEVLRPLLEALHRIGERLPLVFPVHPRTRAAAERLGLAELLAAGGGLRCVEPLPYRRNLGLMAAARVVLTDSGGMQEETTVLGVPCITLRANTERPVTIERGTSRLVGSDPQAVLAAFAAVERDDWPRGSAIPLWDGHAGERVAAAVVEWLGRRA
jgi:UDP-N-acetylglucosamine 2-epimerase (non-hydrolysing)